MASGAMGGGMMAARYWRLLGAAERSTERSVLSPVEIEYSQCSPLLAGAAARVEGRLPWLDGAAIPRADDCAVTLAATTRRADDRAGRLVYHPAALALGVGCERGCAPD